MAASSGIARRGAAPARKLNWYVTQPPAKVYIRSSSNRGRKLSGRSKRADPSWSDGIRSAPEVSHAAVSVTVSARAPASSEFSQNSDRPLVMSAPPTVQPEGSAAMQGSTADDGTAWADKIME